MAVADYANTWDTNNLWSWKNNKRNLKERQMHFVCTEEGASITFVYVDATKGWVTVNNCNKLLQVTFMSTRRYSNHFKL